MERQSLALRPSSMPWLAEKNIEDIRVVVSGAVSGDVLFGHLRAVRHEARECCGV